MRGAVSWLASILIIDDDPAICEMVGDLLRLRGHVVETAANGRDGLERLRARPFDVAIVDVMLPDISGLHLLEAVQASSPDAEVIFITGYVPLSTTIQAIHGAAFAYLKKPFEIDHLVAVLDKALEKQRLTRALRESEERYRLITENTNDAIFLLDTEGRVVFSNRKGEELTGYSGEELRGKPVSSLLTPESAETARARFEAAQTGEEVAPFTEREVLRKDGNRIWVEANVTSVVEDGQVVGRLGVWRNIAERKQLREQLIQAEKLATLGELIAGIAHELNNPLSALVGHAELLQKSGLDAETAARVRRIVEQAHRATRVVRNFLTFVRRHRPEKVAVSVNDIIKQALELLAYQLRVNSIEVISTLASGLPAVAADPHQLQQVVLNLLNNSYQAMAAGRDGGTLRVASALDPGPAVATITIADDGPGILPEHLPRIFEPFFTTKPSGEGTGLGLAIAQGIVSEHGGIITVESTPGRGATFVVRLPLAQVSPPRPEPSPPPAVPTGLRVLVVDDETSLRELMADALSEHGNVVETAAGGREALEKLARSTVDVLVLDLRMPEMAGKDLWAQINRANPALARRIVFCTGDVVGEDVRAFLDSTGCPSVNKPFELPYFLDAVARAAKSL